jgi:hypothetical protein
MKQPKIIGFAAATTLGMAVFAAEPQSSKIEIETSKEHSQTVTVTSGKERIAEIRMIKPGTLEIEAGKVAFSAVPGGEKIYFCSEGSKLGLSLEGKRVFTVSGDSMVIQEVKPLSTDGVPK